MANVFIANIIEVELKTTNTLCIVPSLVVNPDGRSNMENLTQQELIRQAASAMGKKGGKSKSEAKLKACRANAKLGGRPRKIKESE